MSYTGTIPYHDATKLNPWRFSKTTVTRKSSGPLGEFANNGINAGWTLYQ